MKAVEEREFREFVAARLPALRRSAFLLCGDRYAADDVVAIALGKLFRSWRRVSKVQQPDAYVRKMLVHAWLDERRRPWWRRERATADPPEPAPGRKPGAVLETEVAERLHLLALLDRLPAKRRAVLVLRFFDDLSVDETADIVGCSPGTVKTHTARGLADLRALLGAESAESSA